MNQLLTSKLTGEIAKLTGLSGVAALSEKKL